MAKASRNVFRPYRYAIGLGSNRWAARDLDPVRLIEAALAALGEEGQVRLVARSAVRRSRPLGPSIRDFANAAVIVESDLMPPALLDRLQRLERRFGRRRARRWGQRTLDLDILLWSGGRHHTRRLAIPHREIARRPFVLQPLAAVAPGWRMPGTALAVRHLAARLAHPRPGRDTGHGG